MNTIFFTNTIVYLASFSAGMSTNPVNISVALIILAALIFTLSVLSSSVVLMPLIFFLIFVGGILLMFIILSATLPNEKSKSSSLNWNIVVIATGIIIFSMSLPNWESSQEYYVHLKEIVLENQTLMILTSIMLIYFIFCISVVASEELPLRNVMCCLNEWIL